MGDCGLIDAAGRLRFCGRKAERVVTPVGTLFTEPCEQVFCTNHPRLRVALVGLGPKGQMTPALVVETSARSVEETTLLLQTLRQIARSRPHTSAITRFYLHPAFPVDVRHNAKIHRLALARWAATAKPYEPAASS